MRIKVKRNIFISLKRFLLISSFIIIAISWAHAQRLSNDFETLYPGVYTEKEKALVEKYIADNRALEERGGIDVQALIKGTLPKDTPGVGPSFVATEAMIRYNNEKYDPENPVLNDAEYAKRLGYQDIIACPTFGGHDDSFLVPYPREARDVMLVADLNHNITSYKPVYPGDTLYLVVNERHFTDLTPREGSIYRSVGIETKGSVYNQKGEKVNDVIFRVIENLKIYKEDKKPENAPGREPLAWLSRPAHHYTDEDWEFIKDLWSKEKRQGAEPLYWEDVKIGDEPTWTVDGPIEASVSPTGPYGMGTGGSRTMKKEIMNPDIFKTMIRGEQDGIYRLPNREDYVPVVPDIEPRERPQGDAGSQRSTESRRSILINFLGRDIAIRHIHNWIGDHGWLYNIRWSIMSPATHAAVHGYIIPEYPNSERFLELVPKMKGKYVTTHGVTGDLAIVKSYVYDKYVIDGEFFVELAWWIENIEGDIWEEGGATVKLPSKNAK